MSVEQSTYVGYGFVLTDEQVKIAVENMAKAIGGQMLKYFKKDYLSENEAFESLDEFAQLVGMKTDYEYYQFGSYYDSDPNVHAIFLKRTAKRIGEYGDFKIYTVLPDDIEGSEREDLDWIALHLLGQDVFPEEYGWIVGTLWH